jgi:hypothetical protein
MIQIPPKERAVWLAEVEPVAWLNSTLNKMHFAEIE